MPAQQTALAARSTEFEQSMQMQWFQDRAATFRYRWWGKMLWLCRVVGYVDAERGQAILDALLHCIAI